jgi:hypothetical protein
MRVGNQSFIPYFDCDLIADPDARPSASMAARIVTDIGAGGAVFDRHGHAMDSELCAGPQLVGRKFANFVAFRDPVIQPPAGSTNLREN